MILLVELFVLVGKKKENNNICMNLVFLKSCIYFLMKKINL